MNKRDCYVHGVDVWDEYPGVSITIERIYPETAKQMLKHNIGNRSTKRSHNVSKAIENGEWALNGATIVFAKDGRLLDGQHRLQACLRTGKSIDTIVVRGVDTESQISMDSGVKRSAADFLKMRGIGDHLTVSGMCTALMRADSYGLESAVSGSNAARTFTNREIVDFFEESYDLRVKPIAKWSKSINKKYRGFRSSTVSAVLDAFRNVATDEDVEGFVNQLLGRSDATGSVAVLQRRLYDNAVSNGKGFTQKYLAAITVKAWNDYISGDSHSVLIFRAGGAHPEEFPVPVGPAAY